MFSCLSQYNGKWAQSNINMNVKTIFLQLAKLSFRPKLLCWSNRCKSGGFHDALQNYSSWWMFPCKRGREIWILLFCLNFAPLNLSPCHKQETKSSQINPTLLSRWKNLLVWKDILCEFASCDSSTGCHKGMP